MTPLTRWLPSARASSPPTRATGRSKALRLDRRRVDRGEPPRLSRAALRHPRRRAVHQRRDPLRRDAAPELGGRDAVSRAARRQGNHPGNQGRQGREAPRPSDGETITEGLDGLRERFEEYRRLGARFAKWRATYSIGAGRPSEYCVWVNAHALARYAALAQEAGLVPIVEPEVLMDGAHTIDDSAGATGRVLQAVYTELHDQRVDLRGTLLKPNMVLSGYECGATRRARRGRARRRSNASTATCPQRCRASCSCPAVRATRTRRST